MNNCLTGKHSTFSSVLGKYLKNCLTSVVCDYSSEKRENYKYQEDRVIYNMENRVNIYNFSAILEMSDV